MARILLIEDDSVYLDFMRQLLQIDGHEVASAADGEQGLALVREFLPDLIVCDVIMPHLGGYAVLETVRADPENSAVPVLLFSAAMNEEARAIALRRGATGVLAKPFELAQFRSAIRQCLGQDRQ